MVFEVKKKLIVRLNKNKYFNKRIKEKLILFYLDEETINERNINRMQMYRVSDGVYLDFFKAFLNSS